MKNKFFKTITPGNFYQKFEIYYELSNNIDEAANQILFGCYKDRNFGDSFSIKDLEFSVIYSSFKKEILSNNKNIKEEKINNLLESLNIKEIIYSSSKFIELDSYPHKANLGYWDGEFGNSVSLIDNQNYICSSSLELEKDYNYIVFENFDCPIYTLLGLICDENGNIIQRIQNNYVSKDNNYYFKIYKGGKFLYINSLYNFINKKIILLNSSITSTLNLTNEINWILDSFVWNETGIEESESAGSIGFAAGYYASEYFYIKDYSKLLVNMVVAGSATSAITYYNSNKEYIGNLPTGNYNNYDIINSLPTETYYIRFTTNHLSQFELFSENSLITENELNQKLNLIQKVILPSDGNLQQIINNLSGSEINLGTGTWYLNEPLIIPNNTRLKGIRGGTIIKTYNNINCININASSSNISIEDIIFEGITKINRSSTTIENIKDRIGEGSQIGIFATGYSENIFINNCEFRNFDLAGIRLYRTHNLFTKTFKITNCVFVNNWYGLLSDVRSEYHTVMGCSFNYNQIGCFIAGGNNFMSCCHFDANSVGCVISGTLGDNDSHGSIVGSSFNHNTSFGIVLIDINNGFSFDGCHMFDGVFKLYNALGLIYCGGIIAGKIDNENPRENSINMIHNNLFFDTYDGGNITNYTSLDLKNNRFYDGRDSSSINN